MADQLRDVLALLRPESVGENVYLGPQPDDGVPRARVYGGQVAAQAALAAADTVTDRRLHSLRLTFLRPADPVLSLRYAVTTLREGRTFSTRRVTVTQNDVLLAESTVSFMNPMDGHQFAAAAPTAPAPETLPPVSDLLTPAEAGPENAAELFWLTTFDLRYIDPPPLRSVLSDPAAAVERSDAARCRLWMRVAEDPPAVLRSDPLLATGLLIYLSDWSVLDPLQLAVRRNWQQMTAWASLDHAVWLQRPVDFSDWLLFDHSCPSVSGGTGLTRGEVFNRSGELVCTVAQEGYCGPRRPGGDPR